MPWPDLDRTWFRLKPDVPEEEGVCQDLESIGSFWGNRSLPQHEPIFFKETGVTMQQGGMFAELGRTLRALRESKGISQAELARRAGLGKSQLSKYERAKELPQLVTLEKLLAALGAEPLTLFYTAHLLKHRATISPIGILITTTPLLDDPALEAFRRLFGQFLEAFETVMACRLRRDGAAS